MTIQFFNFFKSKDKKTSLDKALKLHLISYGEKLKLEAERAGKRLDKFQSKQQKKRR